MASNYSNAVGIIAQVTAKAQADEGFRSAYLANPNQTLRDAGLDVPRGVTFHVVTGNPASVPVSTASDVYLLLPTVKERVQDESLATASSASCTGTASTCFCLPSTASCASTASTQSCS